MNTTDVAQQALLSAREQLLNEVAKIDKALEALRGQSLSGDFQSLTPQFSGLERKLYSKVKLDRLIKEGYNPKWTYPQKIVYLLKKYGKMYVQDMVDKIAEEEPNLSDDELKTIKARIGYQILDFSKVGTVEREKHGSKLLYWLPEY